MKIVVTIIASLAIALSTAGCIYVPEKNPVYKSADLGNAPNLPLRVGTADRNAVFARWGPPAYRSEHDLAFGYLFAPKIGTRSGLMMGPCVPFVGTIEVSDMDDVWLVFDKRGVLRRYQKHLMRYSWWSGWDDDEQVWKRFIASIPDKPLTLSK